MSSYSLPLRLVLSAPRQRDAKAIFEAYLSRPEELYLMP